MIGFDIGRTFIFYDRSEQVRDNWAQVFDKKAGWKPDQFKDYKRPLGWIARLSMQECANLDGPEVPQEDRKLTKLATAFEDLGAKLIPESVETVFFTPGVGVVRFQLKFRTCEISSRLKDFNERKNRDNLRPLLEDVVEAAAKCYTDQLDSKQSLIKSFRAVDRKKSGSLVFFLLSFVDQATFKERTEFIRDSLAITDEQKQIFDRRSRVGYGKNTRVFVEWSEALVTGNSEEEKRQIETNFIIAMASWSSLSLMDRHSSKDSFDAFAHAVGANTTPLSVNDVYLRTTAYRDVSDASLPIRWTANSKDLHLLEAIHRNWSSDRLREVIEERMQALTLHHQRLQNEQRDMLNSRQTQLNGRLTVFGIIVALSTLASAAADVHNSYHTSGSRGLILSLAFPLLGALIFVALFIWSKYSHNNDAAGKARKHRFAHAVLDYCRRD